MPRTILICTDGSPRAEAALRARLPRAGSGDWVAIASVVEPLDPGLVVGTGMAGGVMTPSEALVMQSAVQDHGQDAVDRLRTDIGIPTPNCRCSPARRGGDLRPRHRTRRLGDRHRVTRSRRVPSRRARFGVRPRGAPRAVPGGGHHIDDEDV